MKENRAEKLFAAMTELDDRLVLEAAPEEKPVLSHLPEQGKHLHLTAVR